VSTTGGALTVGPGHDGAHVVAQRVATDAGEPLLDRHLVMTAMGLVHGQTARLVPVSAHRRDHHGVLFGDRRRQLEGERQQLVVWHDVVRQAEVLGRRGVDEVPRHRHLARLGHADAAGQIDEHGPGVDPHPHMRVGEGGPLGGDDEVAGEGNLEAAGDGGSVHRGDDRYGRVGDGTDEHRQIREPVRAEVAQIEPCAECRVGTGDHDAAGVLGPGDRGDQRRRQLDVHGVAGRRPVQGDQRHAAIATVDEHGRRRAGPAAHGMPPSTGRIAPVVQLDASLAK
jgi:hypothetical protein